MKDAINLSPRWLFLGTVVAIASCFSLFPTAAAAQSPRQQCSVLPVWLVGRLLQRVRSFHRCQYVHFTGQDFLLNAVRHPECLIVSINGGRH
jgi:hypothetical protein